MSTVVGTGVYIKRGVHKKSWTLTGTDDGSPLDAPDLSDKTVQVSGTFNGGTVLIEGSNDGGTTWATLNDPTGSPLSITAAGVKAIGENPQSIRPRCSVAVTSVNINIVSRGAF